MNKRIFLTIILIVLMVFSVSLNTVEAQDSYEFIFVTHSTTMDFWVPVRTGMEEAAEMFGDYFDVEIEVRQEGPTDFDVSGQRDALETVLYAEPDGIVASLTDPDAFDTPVQEAIEQGIPVIGMNTDAEDNPRMAFIGQDLVESGRSLGREIKDRVGTEGVIGLGTEAPGHTALEARIEGVKEVLADTDIEIEVLDTSADVTVAASTFETFLQANPDATGIFSVDATGTDAVGTVVRNLALEGEVVAGGFDLVAGTLSDIQDGYTDFTIDQHPYSQGFQPVAQLVMYHEYGIAPQDIDTGAGFVTIDNVDEVKELVDDGYR